MKIKSKIFKYVLWVLLMLHPFFIYYLLNRNIPTPYLSLLLLVIATISFTHNKQKKILVLGFILATGLLIFNELLFLKVYPVIMNLFFFHTFYSSLHSTPLIEIFATKMGHVMDEDSKKYTRKATIAWAIFSACNGLISLITVFLPTYIWTIYNGFISYMLIGMMMIIEFLVRKRIQNGKNIHRR